jgi:uncharacterized protein (DUF433 family)
MTLKEALINQGNDPDEVAEIIEDMTSRVHDGEDPDDVLDDYGLEPDYVFDLLDLL